MSTPTTPGGTTPGGTDPEVITPEVITSVQNGIGRIELNRPRAINALTRDMLVTIQQAVDAWREDDEVTRIEITGRGERGLCSGADVRALRQQLVDGDLAGAVEFFDIEYPLNADLATYPKPVWSVMDGITMGGGMGLTLHGTRRIGTHTTQLAMPEVGIGLFPDVGATYELSRMPGETGTWMALTGNPVDASSALWAGLLDETDELRTHPDDSWLATNRSWIDECFAGDDPVAILERLEAHDHPEVAATLQVILGRCPLSVAVALELVRRAAHQPSVADVLQIDRVLAGNFFADTEFIEGVRAQLVDKDRNPRWRHAHVGEVTRAEVLAMFGE
ncbi:enoyl-CoA hydratase/isomerase family protein [Aestuariimicrobium sp. Y1814]|uniref:enoyl-CoA hydratase/isomerase family protein n=1 Tax=Aestuariimicrobium sp. Y1814 TaxID=3418742 RepID=UPI003DA78F44